MVFFPKQQNANESDQKVESLAGPRSSASEPDTASPEVLVTFFKSLCPLRKFVEKTVPFSIFLRAVVVFLLFFISKNVGKFVPPPTGVDRNHPC